MPKSERDETIKLLADRILSSMLEELVLDVTLQSHHEVARSRVQCPVCHTRCGSVHTPGSAPTNGNADLSGALAGSSRAATPLSAASNEFAAAKANGNGGTSTPTGSGNLYMECSICSRQVASNRFAPHLASCMGLNVRRGGVRTNSKSKLSSEAGRSASPMSEGGYMSDERANGSSKAKKDDDINMNGKRKLSGTPQISPNKKSKKGKPSGSPVSRVKADPDLSGLPSSSHLLPTGTSHSKIPSKLRDSSTASFLDRSSMSSRESTPGAHTPASSSFSSISPTRPGQLNGAAAAAARRARPPGTGTGPPKRPTPPMRPPVQVQPDYEIEIDHANETGSSTDTDSES